MKIVARSDAMGTIGNVIELGRASDRLELLYSWRCACTVHCRIHFHNRHVDQYGAV
jgi:hypothetical protein